MSTRKSTRTRTTSQRKAAPTKTTPSKAGPRKADPAPEPAPSAPPTEEQKDKPNPFCTKCGARLGPEEGDPFKGSSLLYDDPGFANLTGALFLCGWQSQTLQKVIDGRATVIVIGIPVDEAGNTLNNRKMVTATWEHHPEHGWVQLAEKCGYSRADGTGFQNRTADQLTTYVGNNVAAWMLADIDEPDAPTAAKPKRATSKAKKQAQPAAKPPLDPESKGLPVGSTPAPQDEPEPATAPEPQAPAEDPDTTEDPGSTEDVGGDEEPSEAEELEVAEEEVLAEPNSKEPVSA